MPVQEVLTFETGRNFTLYIANAIGLTAFGLSNDMSTLILLLGCVLLGSLFVKVCLWAIGQK